MGNVVTSNPLIIDTAAATVVISENFIIRKVRWDNSGGDIAPGDQAIIHDKLGNVKVTTTFHDIGTAANVWANPADIDFHGPNGLSMNGMIVPTLTHGKLYIYFDGPTPLKTA